MGFVDDLIVELDKSLRVMAGVASTGAPGPAAKLSDGVMDAAERQHSAGLMRVNHVGEVCAQALYVAQGRFAVSEALKQQFAQAALEEEDHLTWTANRLHELGSRTSLFNPIWYAGSYLIGAFAARMGDARSLGFVVETERQVEAHLDSHLEILPPQDARSRAIVDRMRIDEIRHGAAAKEMGAAEVPEPVRNAMKVVAAIMTKTAYYI
jgi:ubiquinone biosynthesis monooxygenase Coq7